MIFKASTRGMSVDYAKYLLHNKKNEQVRVLDIRGTASPRDAYDSLIEIGAYERFTRSEKPFVQIVINPADDYEMTDEKFRECIDVIGQKTGFSHQPMIAVIHTYKGKDHMHLTFGRYDHETETMIPVDQIGLKLKEALLEIELKQGHEHLLNWKEKQELEKKIKAEKDLELKKQQEAKQESDSLFLAQQALQQQEIEQKERDKLKAFRVNKELTLAEQAKQALAQDQEQGQKMTP